ncbi:MAG: ribosome small subunit-dependent GTPase A [Nocardioidaceae bacterium]
MTSSDSLAPLGWGPAWSDAFQETVAYLGDELRPARVVRVDRGRCTAITHEGAVRTTLGGRVLEQMADDPRAMPCTGDWCALRAWPDGPITIEAVLPRRTAVVRADVGGSSRGQVLGANVDVLAVVVGLLPEPVIGKVERLVALAWASGAVPIVVLTKSDLVGDADLIAADIVAAAPRVQVLTCSVLTGDGIDEIRTLVGHNGTLGLIGSSGAGKSSLVNALAGADVLTIREIREDGRGRHTSVRRELVSLPGGGAVLDTPGMRGVGLVDADDGLAATFADVERLVPHCRFNDCSHTAEPGCAVLAEVNAGTLPVRRLESYRRLQREMAWMEARADARLRAEQTKVSKLQDKARRRAGRSDPGRFGRRGRT